MSKLTEQQVFTITTVVIKTFRLLIDYTIQENVRRCASGIKPYKRTSVERYYITNIFLIGFLHTLIKVEDLSVDTYETIQKVLYNSGNLSISYAVNNIPSEKKHLLNYDLFNLYNGIDFSEDIQIFESKKLLEDISKLTSNFYEWHSKTKKKKTDSHNKIYVTGHHYGLACRFKDTLTSNDDKNELLDSKNNRDFISEGSLLKVKEPTNKVLLYIFEDKTIKLDL
jgi:hypothetical protein